MTSESQNFAKSWLGSFLAHGNHHPSKSLALCSRIRCLPETPALWLIMFHDLQSAVRCSDFRSSVTFWLMSDAHPSGKILTGVKSWSFESSKLITIILCDLQTSIRRSGLRILVTFWLMSDAHHRSATKSRQDSKSEFLKFPDWWLIMFGNLQTAIMCSGLRTLVTFWLMSDLQKPRQVFEILEFWKVLLDDWCYVISKLHSCAQFEDFLSDQQCASTFWLISDVQPFAKFSTECQQLKFWNSLTEYHHTMSSAKFYQAFKPNFGDLQTDECRSSSIYKKISIGFNNSNMWQVSYSQCSQSRSDGNEAQ